MTKDGDEVVWLLLDMVSYNEEINHKEMQKKDEEDVHRRDKGRESIHGSDIMKSLRINSLMLLFSQWWEMRWNPFIKRLQGNYVNQDPIHKLYVRCKNKLQKFTSQRRSYKTRKHEINSHDLLTTDFQIFEWVFLIFLISFFIYLNRGMVRDGGYFFADGIQKPLADGGMDFINLHNRILCEFEKLRAFLKEKKKGKHLLWILSKVKFAHGFLYF